MSFKAKLHEWCVSRRARANYSIGSLPSPTPLFLCVLEVLMSDGTLHTFTPSKGNTAKKKAENDAAQLAMETLLDERNEMEDYTMILQAMSDAIRSPCRNANTAVIEILIEAFELFGGWIPAEYFLIFQGVRAAISRTDKSSRRDNNKCLNLLTEACNAFVMKNPDLQKSKVFDSEAHAAITIEKRNSQYFVRRVNPVSDEENDLLKSCNDGSFNIFTQNIDDECTDIQAEKEVDTTEAGKPQSVTAIILSSDPNVAPREITIDLKAKEEGIITIFNHFSNALQSLNVMTIPIYSREYEEDSSCRSYFSYGVRIFSKVNAIGGVNRIASWLANSTIVGDVVISNVNLGILKSFTFTSLTYLLNSSLPSGFFLRNGADFNAMLPTRFCPGIWMQTSEQSSDNAGQYSKESELTASPYTILQRLVTRRLDSSSSLIMRKVTILEAVKEGDKRAISYIETVSKHEELITVDILSRQNDEEESLLPNALWDKGIVNSKCLLTKSYSADKVSRSIQAAVNTANPTVCKVEISFPLTLLGSCSTQETITLSVNVKLASEPLTCDVAPSVVDAQQLCSLKALHLIQQYGENELKGLPPIVPKASMCPDIPYVSSATMINFTMTIGTDTKTFSNYLGLGMMVPSLEAALCDIEVGSSKTITFTPRYFLADFLLKSNHEIVDISVVSKDVINYTAQASKSKIDAAFSNAKRFSPSLQDQRKRFVAAILRAVGAQSWCDLGCGDGSLMLDTFSPLNKVTYVPNLKTLAAIDINSKKLGTFNKQFEILQSEYSYNSLEKVSILEGSICEPDSFDLLSNILGGGFKDKVYDVVSCIEVIEHLPTEQHATIAATFALLRLRPKYAIFSTPNYEANRAIRLLPSKAINKEGNGIAEVLEKDLLEGGKVPFREADHKFEFTRAQFKDWVDTLLEVTNGSYRAEYSSVGNKLPGSEEFGGASQIVVFVRCDDIKKPIPHVLDDDDEPCKIAWTWHSQS